MGPIELLFLAVAVIIAMIGLARGYVKELGNTLVLMSAIFLLTFLRPQIESVLERIFQPQNANAFSSTFFTLVFIAIVFASYSGRTLAFSGSPAPPPQGTIISLIVGMLNGYLVAGTIWYFQHHYEYPIQRLVPNLQPDLLTATARTMVEYLPPVLFENPIYWAIPVVILLMLKVRG